MLTLRQLRQVASDLGVSLYSRKSKEELVEAISSRQGDQSINLAALEAEMAPASRPASQTRVVFLPRDPQWAYVFWEIGEDDRLDALDAGATQLCLRVADVTGLAGGWISLAFSSVARVPALHPSEQILDQFVPFSLDTAPASLAPSPLEPADVGLHERLYQTATSRWRHLGRGSEAFHDLGDEEFGDSALSASGIGLWASGRSESGAGPAARQRSFWLVADAELIVYGATDPAARLTIGGEEVPLSPEGTFRIQVPFRDGQQVYPIEAVAADGEQKRNITLEFRRATPEDNSNPASQAVAEWF